MIEPLKNRATDFISEEPDERNAGIEPAENALAFVVALGVTFRARNAVQAGSRTTMDRDALKNPASHEVDWLDALTRGAVSGAVSGADVGMARIASRRDSSLVYQSIRSS